MSQKNDAGPCRGCLAEMQAAKPEEFKKLLNRLNRAEGQLKCVKRMLEEGAQCRCNRKCVWSTEVSPAPEAFLASKKIEFLF